jgi:hypothetical protein
MQDGGRDQVERFGRLDGAFQTCVNSASRLILQLQQHFGTYLSYSATLLKPPILL